MPEVKRPKWTVLYNVVSERSSWIGTAWEFFDNESSAQLCYDKQLATGNCPTKRPFHESDIQHLGAAHRF